MQAAKIEQLLCLKTASQFDKLISEFLISREAGGCSRRTLQYYREELGCLRDYLADHKVCDPTDITPTHLRGFLLDMAGHRNPGGVHCAYRVCKTFLRWYEAEYQPQGWQNPIRHVKPPKLPKQVLDPIDLAEFKAMLATCDSKAFTDVRDRAMLLCLLDTGCRASEFISLDLADVNLATGAVQVRNGKGGKGRVTFLGAKARRELARYLRLRQDRCPALWVTEQGTRLTYSGLRQIVRRRALRAGVKEPSLHSFRRSFALLSLRNGCDVYSLQKLMGHADLSVLRRYLAQTESDLKAAHERSGPVDNWL